MFFYKFEIVNKFPPNLAPNAQQYAFKLSNLPDTVYVHCLVVLRETK